MNEQDDGSATAPKRAEKRAKRSALAEEYAVKMHAALWVIGAVAAVLYTDFFTVCRNSEQVNR